MTVRKPSFTIPLRSQPGYNGKWLLEYQELIILLLYDQPFTDSAHDIHNSIVLKKAKL